MFATRQCNNPRAGKDGPGSWSPPAGPQAVGAADGQLIRTLTPELVDETRTSSARPEITASPNPAGIAASSAPWTMAAAPGAAAGSAPGLTLWPLAPGGA